MKQVIQNSPMVVDISQVNSGKSYGMIYYNGKAFLLPTEYRGGNYYWLCAENMTICNRILNGVRPQSFKEAIQNALDEHYKVYEFDSSEELLKWLAAKD